MLRKGESRGGGEKRFQAWKEQGTFSRGVANPIQPAPAIRPLDSASVALSRFISILVPSGSPPNCIFHLKKRLKDQAFFKDYCTLLY